MNEAVPVGSRQFVEGIGGRLAASKSKSYAKAVLAVEARNNPFIGKYMLAGDLACVLSANELGITPDADAKTEAETAAGEAKKRNPGLVFPGIGGDAANAG